MIRNQHPFSSKVEEESNEEIFEQVETKEPSLERVEVIKHTLAQEHGDLFTDFSPLNQNISGLQEDNTAIYDEPSSSDNNEYEEEFLSQKNLFLDPMEEKITLVETYLLNNPNQVLFEDPFAHFLKTFEEEIEIVRSSVSLNVTIFFSIAPKE